MIQHCDACETAPQSRVKHSSTEPLCSPRLDEVNTIGALCQNHRTPQRSSMMNTASSQYMSRFRWCQCDVTTILPVCICIFVHCTTLDCNENHTTLSLLSDPFHLYKVCLVLILYFECCILENE